MCRTTRAAVSMLHHLDHHEFCLARGYLIGRYRALEIGKSSVAGRAEIPTFEIPPTALRCYNFTLVMLQPRPNFVYLYDGRICGHLQVVLGHSTSQVRPWLLINTSGTRSSLLKTQ